MKKYLIFGNAESVHLVKWVKELVKHFEVFVISSKNTHTEIHSIIPEKNIFNLDLPISEAGGNYHLLKKYSGVKRIIKKINPDYVNAHYISSHGFLIALIKKLSGMNFTLIQSAWGSDILVSPFKNKLYYNITRFSLNNANLITSDSNYMTDVIKSISNTPTMTFVFGLDKLPDVALTDKKQSLFFSNRGLSENYNIQEIIKLIQRLSNEDSNIKLIISNDGPLRNDLQKQLEDSELSKTIEFVGFLSAAEQNQIYKEAQYYISIPESDSTSVSLIEALAYGCIPIVSDIPANHEWVSENKNGIYYHPELTLKQIQLNPDSIKGIFDFNRNLIKEKGIFPDLINNFVNAILDI